MPADSPQSPGARRLSLAQADDLARSLHRELLIGDADAAFRVTIVHPRFAGRTKQDVLGSQLRFADAQLVVARELGFTSWPRLELDLDSEDAARDRVGSLIEAALDGDRARVVRLLEVDPGLVTDDLSAAAVLGDIGAAHALLARDQGAVARPGGPRSWEPLLYACHSGLLATAARRPGLHAVARLLLERGADPSASYPAEHVPEGRLSALGGAVIAGDVALATILLDGGADLNDRAPILETCSLWLAAAREDPSCLALLLARGPAAGLVTACLTPALAASRPRAVRLLLEHGADPNGGGGWGRAGTHLHHAVDVGAGADVLDLLLECGGDPSERDRHGRSPLALAVRRGDVDGAARLERAGAAMTTVAAVDRLLGAVFRGDQAEVARLAREVDAGELTRSDHGMVARAAADGRAAAVARLLDLGLVADVPDATGATALHHAVGRGELETVELLIDHGADHGARDSEGCTPLDLAVGALPGAARSERSSRRAVALRLLAAGARATWATPRPCGDEAVEAKLAGLPFVRSTERGVLFERAADCVVTGRAPELRERLAAHPDLARARSPRSHRATLLHYVAANGLEPHRQTTPPNAVEIERILLAAGAEPDALARTYGGGTAQTVLSLLASSGHPAAVGLQAELIRVLCAGGADPDGVDGDGTPLATAIAFRCRDAVDGLAASGASLAYLSFAAAAGRRDLVERMWDGDGPRADVPRCTVPWQRTPEEPRVAAEQALVVAARFARLDVVRVLLDGGVDPSAHPDGWSALHEASFAGWREGVDLLLDRGADTSIRDRQWRSTPLVWAHAGGQAELEAYLLTRVDVDLVDAVELALADRVHAHLMADPGLADGPDGDGILLRTAAFEGHADLVEAFLAHGADPTLANDEGRTALDWARRRGHDRIVLMLEAAMKRWSAER